jgi:transposase
MSYTKKLNIFLSVETFSRSQTDLLIIFPDLPDVEVEGVEGTEEILLTLRTTSPTASCPSCETASSRIQSRYTRTLRDVPSVGHPIRLIVHARRFFCHKRTCAQKIFAERLPSLCRPHAQRTTRLQQGLCALGLAIGGQAGADVGSELGLNGSRDTILRLVHQAQSSSSQPPRIIGVDDWAWKRRLHYGTLICDLERGLPLDVLADRTVETVSAWLKARPSIEIVSRDGSTEYASAITKGAPQARQVSDRWHLAKNLSQCLSTLLAGTFAELRQAEQKKAAVRAGGRSRPHTRGTAETVAIQQTQRLRQAERSQRYEQILALRRQGMGTPQIAVQMNMAERTIRHWLARGSAPDFRHRWSRAQAHLGASHLAYLRQRWEQGCHKVSQLDRELRSLGYQGPRRSLYRAVATFDLASGLADNDQPGPDPKRWRYQTWLTHLMISCLLKIPWAGIPQC